MLRPGTTCGPYEILTSLGAGGMGEVYRARDTRLNRDVALKFLPDAFAHDAERVARFTREAQTLAALNHPHIATIYGIVEAPAAAGAAGPDPHVHALAMELVDGDDLSAVIARGPVPPGDAIAIAKQIAEALEAAHEQGIIHRDLKPANIKVRADGTVKVLDFGLAKAVASSYGSARGSQAAWDSAVTNSPTAMPLAMTGLGVVLGTAAYMAPEQARGKTVDRRADIWAFGVVLYEMLTGRALFAGESISDTVAAVLRKDIELSALPLGTPAGVRRLVARCLERDPRLRLRDIGEARIALESPEPADPAPVPVAAPRRTWPWLVALAGTALVAATAAHMLTRGPAAPRLASDGHFIVELPADAPLVTLEIPGVSEAPLAVSPDGRQLVYVGAAGATGSQLYVRTMADVTPRTLPGTAGATAPFFSPDGQWIAFFAGGKLKKTRLDGGTPATLADAPNGQGGSWGTAGEIVFAPSNTGNLVMVADTGGVPRGVTTLDFAAGDDAHRWPQLLPGGRLLFTVIAWSRETSDVVVVDLATGARRTVQAGVDFARYVPDDPGAAAGHLVFVRGGALVAARFDPAGTVAADSPVAVVDGVRDAQFDVSSNGVLAYAPGVGKNPDYSLVWTDRMGKAVPINDLVRGYEDLHLSPDGRLVALTVEEAGPESEAHVWLADTTRGTLTRATFEGFSRDPVWAPDGKSFVVGSKRGENTFGIYRHSLDGRTPVELLWASPIPIWPDPQSWTPDGQTLVFSTKGKATGDDIWLLSLADKREARPWLQTPATEWAGRLSPDGRWIAYNSDESGRDEVYVQPFPGPGGKWIVSQDGGYNAIWSRDGREIFYRHGNQVMAVTVETSPAFAAGKPQPMFSGRYRLTGRDFDVSPDGRRFVMMRTDEPRTTTRLGVLLDWWRALSLRGRPSRPG